MGLGHETPDLIAVRHQAPDQVGGRALFDSAAFARGCGYWVFCLCVRQDGCVQITQILHLTLVGLAGVVGGAALGAVEVVQVVGVREDMDEVARPGLALFLEQMGQLTQVVRAVPSK